MKFTDLCDDLQRIIFASKNHGMSQHIKLTKKISGATYKRHCDIGSFWTMGRIIKELLANNCCALVMWHWDHMHDDVDKKAIICALCDFDRHCLYDMAVTHGIFRWLVKISGDNMISSTDKKQLCQLVQHLVRHAISISNISAIAIFFDVTYTADMLGEAILDAIDHHKIDVIKFLYGKFHQPFTAKHMEYAVRYRRYEIFIFMMSDCIIDIKKCKYMFVNGSCVTSCWYHALDDFPDELGTYRIKRLCGGYECTRIYHLRLPK
jgi:hypothetical protein